MSGPGGALRLGPKSALCACPLLWLGTHLPDSSGAPPLSASLPIRTLRDHHGHPCNRVIDKETWSWTGDETLRGPSAGEWQSWVSSLDLFISKVCSFSSHPISLPEPLLYTGLAFLTVSNYSFTHLFISLFFLIPLKYNATESWDLCLVHCRAPGPSTVSGTHSTSGKPQGQGVLPLLFSCCLSLTPGMCTL